MWLANYGEQNCFESQRQSIPMGTALNRVRENPAVVTALVVVGLFIALSVLGLQAIANVVLFVGIPIVVPLAYLLFADRQEPTAPPASDDSTSEAASKKSAPEPTDELDRLREQYASGEITEVEFEERVEAHLEPQEDERSVPEDGAAIEAKLERAQNGN